MDVGHGHKVAVTVRTLCVVFEGGICYRARSHSLGFISKHTGSLEVFTVVLYLSRSSA